MSLAPRRGDRAVPPHQHGSVYHYSIGCDHELCRQAARDAKRKGRARHRSRLVEMQQTMPDGSVEMRLYNPALAKFWEIDKPARHGTVIGRKEYRCDCWRCAATHPTSRRLEK